MLSCVFSREPLLDTANQVVLVYVFSWTFFVGRFRVFLMKAQRARITPSPSMQRSERIDGIFPHRRGKWLFFKLADHFHTPRHRVPRWRMDTGGGEWREN